MSKPATTVDLAAFKKHLADSLERNAKSAGQTIVKETLTCEMGIGSQVVIAALKREQLPTEKEITAGVDLFFGYVSTNGQRALPPGYYRIRLALPGYEKSGAVKVSFIDADGQSVHSVTGKGKPRRLKSGTDDATVRAFGLGISICSRKKCFNINRNGFLDWDWGCTDSDGDQINCLDRQP